MEDKKVMIPDWLHKEMTMIPDWLRKEVNDYFAVPLNISPPATILDIGANVGAFAQRAHQEWPAARITCYEPMPFVVEHLRQNVSPDWCEVVPCAVRAQAGEDDIIIGSGMALFTTNSFRSGIPRQTDSTMRVRCAAASEIPSHELVKVDTEGSEVEILKNLNLDKTRAILLEFHSHADAATLKQLLVPTFDLVHDESGHDAGIGTMIFVRQRVSG
jgi:FkbM family methyltransferase